MIGVVSLTKKDLIELIEEEFPDARDTETIAVILSFGESCDSPKQQCLQFNKEVIHE